MLGNRITWRPRHARLSDRQCQSVLEWNAPVYGCLWLAGLALDSWSEFASDAHLTGPRLAAATLYSWPRCRTRRAAFAARRSCSVLRRIRPGFLVDAFSKRLDSPGET